MISKEAACKIIEELVARFDEQVASYKKRPQLQQWLERRITYSDGAINKKLYELNAEKMWVVKLAPF